MSGIDRIDVEQYWKDLLWISEHRFTEILMFKTTFDDFTMFSRRGRVLSINIQCYLNLYFELSSNLCAKAQSCLIFICLILKEED